MSSLFQDDGPTVEHGERKVLLATTCYDSPDASYTFSMQRSREALAKAGIKSAYYLLQGNCHVDDARNVMVQEFLLSDCTEMIFLDADVSWKPQDLVRLCSYEADLIGGVYPFRKAISRGKGDMPVRMIEGVVEPESNGLIEVEGLPTGFMRIKRHVLAKLAVDADSYWNKDDKRSKVPILFERCYDKETEIRWGGDLNFCNKWRAIGGKIYAIYEMFLGHTAKSIIRDSLGGALRRQAGLTLKHICDKIREGKEERAHYSEAFHHVNNHFGALEDVLLLSVIMARKANGPIIETGSGLTSILMASANPDHLVYAIEHDPYYAMQLKRMAHEAGVSNIAIVHAPIKNGWYDIEELKDIPEQFAMGLCDGPPRALGSRMGFFEHLAGKCDTIVCDDADTEGYQLKLKEWASDNKRDIQIIQPRSALITKKDQQ